MQPEPKPDVILVADDSDDDVHFMLRAFRRSGLLNPVFVVRDGDEAVAYLNGEGKFANRDEYPLPSLLLLDLKMPNRNGFEVLDWIRRHPRLKRMRVVVLTNSGEVTDINRSYALGANSFMVKPVNQDQLFAISDALKGYWMWMSEGPADVPEHEPVAAG
jgi:CheY-like chemotaxis protein